VRWTRGSHDVLGGRPVIALGTAPDEEGGVMDSQLEVNKAVVRDFYELAVNQKEPERAVAQYFGPAYRQHNPDIADGPAAVSAFLRALVTEYPAVRMEFKRQVAEGALVMLHSHLIREAGDRGVAVADLYRLENGQLVEHWDVLQEVPESSAHDNTMF
jgi:predicted SnoaL-like aldol condensation-catalyzing enzyme